MKWKQRRWHLGIVIATCLVPGSWGQAKKTAQVPAAIDVEKYEMQISLDPERHEMTSSAAITFRALQTTDRAIFELSENLAVQRVLDPGGVEIEFGQDETGPGQLVVRFRKPIAAGATSTLRVEYSGGFDRDRFSRIYARDESSAYLGPEGSYLFYSSKWYPITRYLSDRAQIQVEVTVPLGFTVVGPGLQQPVLTKGISEVFTWRTNSPVVQGAMVAGKYFEKMVQARDFSIDCFAPEQRLDAMTKLAEPVGQILDFYQKTFGPAAAGKDFRIVEVDERASRHPGMLGVIFVTPRDVELSSPPLRDLARKIAYQWWMETVGPASVEDLWLVDGLAYYSAALYLGSSGGAAAFREEINNLAVLGLKFEDRSAVRMGFGLGYRSEPYESVVAGKGAWILHMLRQLLGEAKFERLIQQYVTAFSGKGGSTTGFRQLAEKQYGKDLGWFVAEWIDSIGVPTLEADYIIFKTTTGFRVSGSIKQDRDLFRMPIEVAVDTKEGTKTGNFELSGKSTPFDISASSMPMKVILDPEGKILRDSPELQTAVQLSLGDDLKQKGNLLESIRAYEKALQINPRRSIAHYRMGEVFYEQFNLQAAANAFRESLNGDKDPKWVETWCYIYLGKIYDILSQRQRAMAEYTKALNTKDDTFGAQAEAKTWLEKPFTRERTAMEKDDKEPN